MDVSHIEGTKTFISGYWDINDAQAEALVGGWLYLHETKARPSYFGGKIIDFRHELRPDVVRNDRIGLIFYPRAEAKKSVSWRGQQHGRAWTGRLARPIYFMRRPSSCRETCSAIRPLW
jgi:hypothetical protein